MASKYWIKLYHEIIDDPKMMRMSEVLFARCIKLFLLAGDYGKDGQLPDPEDAGWRLRIPAEEMESDFIELQKLGIFGQKDGTWFVTKWEQRQGAMSEKRRSRLRRKERHRERYETDGPADVVFETGARPDTDRNATASRPENGIDKKRIEENRKDKEVEAAIGLISSFCDISGIPKPRNRKEQAQWEEAALEIVSMASSPSDAVARMKDAYELLKENDLMVSGPQSLVKTIRGSMSSKGQSGARSFLDNLRRNYAESNTAGGN